VIRDARVKAFLSTEERCVRRRGGVGSQGRGSAFVSSSSAAGAAAAGAGQCQAQVTVPSGAVSVGFHADPEAKSEDRLWSPGLTPRGLAGAHLSKGNQYASRLGRVQGRWKPQGGVSSSQWARGVSGHDLGRLLMRMRNASEVPKDPDGPLMGADGRTHSAR
jgi:hypothetical protein